jgi:2-phosphosulfolactate phosphatase
MDQIQWHCHDCFHGMQERETAGGIVVVIDVLRASTTIVTALANGAAGVRPELSPEAARRAAGAVAPPGSQPGACLLGGERGGLRIDGFDLGNAPREYSRPAVVGRRIVTTTTNGTAAVAACPQAEAILIGALVNRRAVAVRAMTLALAGGGRPRPIHLVCAGTDGEVTEEDVLAAGAILDAAGGTRLDAAASAALERFRGTIRGATDPRVPLAAALADSRGGKNLLAIGMAADIGDAAAIDTIPVVPRLERSTGWFHADS